MTKKITSTLLLFATAIGMGLLSLYWLRQTHSTEDTLIAFLYLIPSVAAFGALLMLPFKKQ
jgi:hypothetical protein